MRRLSRIVMAKRFRTWFGPTLNKAGRNPETMEVGALHLAQGMMQRLEYAMRLDEPLFVYLEMILLAAYGTICCEELKTNHPREAAACAGALLHGLTELCAPFPRMAALLRRDLAALRIEPPATTEHCPTWQNALDALAVLVQGGIFTRIENFLPLLLEEDGDRADFSFYDAL
jgi:hypothetical protein